MRTTLDLPNGLLEEAQKLLRFKSKTDTVAVALSELIRRHRIDQLKALYGQVVIEADLNKSRRRRKAA